jgi:hypothetical protein
MPDTCREYHRIGTYDENNKVSLGPIIFCEAPRVPDTPFCEEHKDNDKLRHESIRFWAEHDTWEEATALAQKIITEKLTSGEWIKIKK